MLGVPVLQGCLSTPATGRIPARAFQGRTRVACLGDSITFGAGLRDRPNEAYPAVLGDRLGPAYETRNFGVNGTTLLRAADFPFAVTREFQEAREFLPEVVVVALGTNDSKPHNWRYRNELERDTYWLVRAFMTLPSQPVVYLCTPPPVFKNLGGIRSAIVSGDIAPRLRAMSAREGWPLIPLDRALAGAADHFPDGVHPDATAAALIAERVESAFRGK